MYFKKHITGMEYHVSQLRKVCRVCGKRLNKSKGKEPERGYLVEDSSKELAEVFGLDTSEDQDDTHPKKFCHTCRVYMRRWHTRGEGTPAVGRWVKHSEPECTVSNTYLKIISVTQQTFRCVIISKDLK